jgi:iron-sulfur cluster assembly protein
MLTVTEAAAQAINSLVTENKMPDGAGLRIAPQGESTRSEGLGLSIAKAPAEDDTVLEAHGAKIFLAATVVHALDQQELDTDPEDGGGSGFIVNRRPGRQT